MNAQAELKIRDMEILFQPFHSRKLSTPTRIVLCIHKGEKLYL